MLYQVPSGSKSSSSGRATGFALTNALRSAICVVDPSSFTRRIPLSACRNPCEQPAPDSSAYSVCPTNATSATPLVRPPESGDVELDGSPVATGVTAPCGPILTMLAVKPPEYGPIGAGTCSQSACVVCIVPPVPPSATYRLPSGP